MVPHSALPMRAFLSQPKVGSAIKLPCDALLASSRETKLHYKVITSFNYYRDFTQGKQSLIRMHQM